MKWRLTYKNNFIINSANIEVIIGIFKPVFDYQKVIILIYNKVTFIYNTLFHAKSRMFNNFVIDIFVIFHVFWDRVCIIRGFYNHSDMKQHIHFFYR